MTKHGMSLVEIMVSILIFLASMVPLWGLMGTSTQQVVRFSEEIVASQLTVEILEQIKNSHAINVFSGDNDTYHFTLTPGSAINIGNQTSALTVNVGTFETYLAPELTISSEVVKNKFLPEKTIGRIITLEMRYKSKEGKSLTYKLRGFVSVKN